MILEVFSLYDNAIQAYTQPFYLHSTNEAIRSILNEAKPDSKLGMNPQDFILFRLGEYDNIAGRFKQDENVRIGSISELMHPEKETQLEAV